MSCSHLSKSCGISNFLTLFEVLDSCLLQLSEDIKELSHTQLAHLVCLLQQVRPEGNHRCTGKVSQFNVSTAL
eukprot:3967680-Amphidinium_carterae.1